MHEGKPVLNIQIGGNGASTARLYMLNVPRFSSRYFNKIKRTSRLGRLHALSLEILWSQQVSKYCYWKDSYEMSKLLFLGSLF